MNRPNTVPANRPITESMIELARCSKVHRIILAGQNGRDHLQELHRRKFFRVATTASCGLPRGQYDVAMVDWSHSIKALTATLDWLVHFLAGSSVLVIRLDAGDRTEERKLASLLERFGFRIEAGTRYAGGIAVSARRRDAAPMAIAA
jgi:hypothetical protein